MIYKIYRISKNFLNFEKILNLEWIWIFLDYGRLLIKC